MSAEVVTPQGFEDVFNRLGLDSETLRQPVESTFIPAGPVRAASPLDSLPELALDDGTERAPELAMAHLLGEGGRGEVRLARQLSLRRPVAVKSPKNPSAGEVASELLREARIMGGLEHPNIIPIYALGRDSRGRVLLVMKKLDGVPWGKLLRDQGPRRSDAQLERHLEVFRQVCNAVEFAHSQGVVHRDLKPENVMVGDFGEVVLLDWGLAVSLQGDPERGLPAAREVRGLAGTPAYMAPELVTGDGARVGPWTDVYLLGAILHELFAGAPPHSGGTLAEVLERAYHSAPQPYGPQVPQEIAAICLRAMAKDPRQRFASAAELREAVHAYQNHRQSAALADEAMRRLRALPVHADARPFSTEDAAAAQVALAQCRFGFEQALKSWPESQVAREGLAATADRELDLAVRQSDLASAVRILGGLESPSPEQRARVDALRARLEADHAEMERLRQLSRDFDPAVSRRGRSVFLGLTAVAWSVIPLVVGLLEREGRMSLDTEVMLWGLPPFALLTLFFVWFGRRELFSNRFGRLMVKGFALLVLSVGLIRLVDHLTGVDAHVGYSFELALYALCTGLMALAERRFISAAAVYLCATLACAIRPEQAAFIGAAANFAALFPIGVLWDHFACWAPEDVMTSGG